VSLRRYRHFSMPPTYLTLPPNGDITPAVSWSSAGHHPRSQEPQESWPPAAVPPPIRSGHVPDPAVSRGPCLFDVLCAPDVRRRVGPLLRVYFTGNGRGLSHPGFKTAPRAPTPVPDRVSPASLIPGNRAQPVLCTTRTTTGARFGGSSPMGVASTPGPGDGGLRPATHVSAQR